LEDKKVINKERRRKWSQDLKANTRNVSRDRNSALARERDLALQRQWVAQGKWLQDAKASARNVWRERNSALARKRDLALQRERVEQGKKSLPDDLGRDRNSALARELDLALQRQWAAQGCFLESLKEP
jgi:hypothetical protein